ncbi:MAG: nicotinate phosphoribosyltransferase [Planctomycetota bacterium]
MTNGSPLYGHSLALLTDLYQLTMSYGYWKTGGASKDAVFHLFYRKNPFRGGYAIACGLAPIVEILQAFQFCKSDIEYLGSLTGNDGKPLFEAAFLRELEEMEFSCDIDAVPEGTVVFPHEPLLRVRGPIIQCQILETFLLNVINFQTLIATQSARICSAAGDDPVLEFGLRRAQGIDGGLSASRAAYVGGCAATSNVLAGKLYDIPIKGTHAHSWVMSFDDELSAFEAYAEAMPNNCVFLVDTFDTLEGVKKAIQVGKKLRQRGYEMMGVRLDSGDLALLSIETRKLLDAAGFPDAAIVASNDLNERVIESLQHQGARINVWGVGTKLATAFEQPALGGVYKLSAIRKPGGNWEPRIKLSEQAIKTSNPGILQVRRFENDSEFTADLIFDENLGVGESTCIVDPRDPTLKRSLPVLGKATDLLVPVFRSGQLVAEIPTIHEARGRANSQLNMLPQGVRRFMNPHQYPVGLESELHELKSRLIREARGEDQS